MSWNQLLIRWIKRDVHKIGIEKEDVIFCGRQAIDGDTAQVGPITSLWP